MFEPIAIVGRGACFPDADTVEALGDNAENGHVALRAAPAGRCESGGGRLLSTVDAPLDGMLHDVGGYVRTAPSVPNGLRGPWPERVAEMDPLFQWVLQCTHAALIEAGIAPGADALGRAGLILGNLSFPSEAMARLGEQTVLQSMNLAFTDARPTPHPLDRFMSGLPARATASALGLGGPAFCLDAACASSLYALRFACDALQQRQCDVMLAGAVNRADPLFLHVGFTALSALSPTARSRPFAADADGLVPGEGCGVVCLMRLSDAIQSKRTIHGVIRGIGLSNDGRAKNLLAPSSEGQVRALRSAYAMADIDPARVGMLECHATGTPLGDRVEVETLAAVFGATGRHPIPTGSLKGNIGHLITAAGMGGLFKVLESFRRETILPSVAVDEECAPLREHNAALTLQTKTAPFPQSDLPRVAAVSAFGFGGNNAHLVVEAFAPDRPALVPVSAPRPSEEIVVVASGVRAGHATDWPTLLRAVEDGFLAHSDHARFDAAGLRFPPNDIAASLPQQILMLEAARDAAAALSSEAQPEPLSGPRTGVYVGMGCDADVTTPGLRWRLTDLIGHTAVPPAGEVVSAAHVLGQMPNIPANRLSAQLDARGPGFTVSAEALSGLNALALAQHALLQGEIDVALVGATEVSCPVRDPAPLRAAGIAATRLADAALALVVTTAQHAAKQGWTPLLHLVHLDVAAPAPAPPAPRAFTDAAGHAQAAVGLFEATVAAFRGADTPMTLGDHFGGYASIQLKAAPDWAATAAQHGGRRPARFVQQKPMHRRFEALAATPDAEAMPPAPALYRAVAGGTLRLPLASEKDTMPPAPTLYRVAARAASPTPTSPQRPTPVVAAPIRTAAPPPRTVTPAPVPTPRALPPSAAPIAASAASASGPVQAWSDARADLAAAHTTFLAHAARAQQAFLDVNARFIERASGTPAASPSAQRLPLAAPPVAQAAVPPTPTPRVPPPVAQAAVPPTPTPSASTPTPTMLPVARPADADAGAPTGARLAALRAEPWLDRAALERVASDKISTVLGDVFARQDHFPRQVRMPEPPLLLTDRVLWTDASPGVLESGRSMVTESDVTYDKWYIQDGRIPASILIESGQSDLLLISYMGVDFENRGERTYRLLGCDLTYGDTLPQVGDTLHYDIHIDGFANHGATKIFFFHSDCRVGGPDGPVVLSVREGQAGFFSDEELAQSGGILWKPTDVDPATLPAISPPLVTPNKTALDEADLRAIAAGDVFTAFGKGFERAAPHVRTPALPAGEMQLVDRVNVFEPEGGPWGRGYLRAELDLTGDNWFFPGHFKDDPCMPGTIMFEGCLQTLRLMLMGTGRTLDKDGWRFEPVGDVPYKLRCRGQATPSSRNMVYEVFVREYIDAPHPTVIADILVTVDGLKGLHCAEVGLRLVPDFPLSSHPELLGALPKPSGNDAVGGVGHPDDADAVINQRALLATGWGQPSEAFPNLYEPFDDGTRVPRLPGPPYHFMSRVESLTGPDTGAFTAGNEVVVAYDVPPDAWFFDDTPNALMPFSVLLEVALQPCGWLSSYTGSILQSDTPLYYRNLDGQAALSRSISRRVGTLKTWARLDRISHSAGMMIQNFTLHVRDDEGILFDGTTVFGFFPGGALAHQLGTGSTGDEQAAMAAAARRPDLSVGQLGALYQNRLAVLDRVTAWEPAGGQNGLGRLIAEKDIHPTAWFFKAHFFQDPVQPGSLGIEAMLQTLRYWCIQTGFAQDAAELLPIAVGETSWKYRGQVVPKNTLVQIEMEILEVNETHVTAEAWLWVDGLRIYHAPRIGLSRR